MRTPLLGRSDERVGLFVVRLFVQFDGRVTLTLSLLDSPHSNKGFVKDFPVVICWTRPKGPNRPSRRGREDTGTIRRVGTGRGLTDGRDPSQRPVVLGLPSWPSLERELVPEEYVCVV